MNDNFLSTITGSITSLLGMIVGMIHVETMIEVAVYGFIGGAVGLLAKWLIQHIRSKCEQFFKRRKGV
jgi:uncharacterized membrane protein